MMFIKGNLREDLRTPFVVPVRYSVSVFDMLASKETNGIAVSVDIGKGGMGILTDVPLEKGHVLTFEDAITMKDHFAKKAAVVKWTGKIDGKYRVGLQFV
jgi:hypothetical protein